MNISALWERTVLLTMARHGIRSEHIELDQTSMKALCIKKVPAHSSIDAKLSVNQRIVCVHGLGSSGSAYSNLLPHLVHHWNEVWAPSAPSHGMSPPFPKLPALETKKSAKSPRGFQTRIYEAWEQCLLQLSENDPIDLLGISLGGAISIRFTARFPERVSSLMLCSPAGAILDEYDIAHLKKTFSMDSPGDGLRFLKTLYHQVPWWSTLLAPLVQMNLKRPEAQSLIQNLKPGDGLKPSEFQQIQVPTLLIWGQRERILPTSSIKKLIKLAPKDFKLLQPKLFSHTPQKEFPEELAQYLIRFQKNRISKLDHT